MAILNGQDRGPAQSICNLNFEVRNVIAIFSQFEYYNHLFIKDLCREKDHMLSHKQKKSIFQFPV